MQLHDLKRNKNNRKSKQIGRGGKRGKTSGRGTKGQNARAGRKKRPEMRDIVKKFPKLRGRGRNFLKSIKAKTFVIKTSDLANNFTSAEMVNYSALHKKGLISNNVFKGRNTKIVLAGKIERKLNISGIKISAGARSAIKKAGGSVS